MSAAFAERPEALSRWATFTAKPGVGVSASLGEVIEALAAFLMPVVEALVAGRELAMAWPAGGPWKQVPLEPT